MNYLDIFDEEAILLDLQAPDSSALLDSLADGLSQRDPALQERRGELLEALVERERRGSTGSSGVAIPHVKMEGLERVSAVVGVHRGGLDFGALDGEPVHVFFSVVRPAENADEHLELLRWIAGVAQHQDFVSFACQAERPQQVLDLLAELTPA